VNIKTVTVVGANGTMGCNVSGIFASFGNAKVYMISRDIEKSKIAVMKAVKSVRADSISGNLIPADYSMLDSCVKESNLVFESVAENLDVKLAVTKQIAKNLRKDAIICSGTSGLSITTLSEALPEILRENYLGVHFYNPPYNMTLCEVIPTAHTNALLLKEIKTYLSDVLFRTVVESKDSPAFIGNRIGFHFINKALQFAEKYKQDGGIDYIDAILGAFTGRSMPPLVTSDFVGLDVHKAIVDNIHMNTNDYAHDDFVLPRFTQELINQGCLGRKSNGGFYKTILCDDGTKQLMVYDILSGEYRVKNKYQFPFVEQILSALKIGDYKSAFEVLINDQSAEAKICVEFLLEYIVYSLFVSEKVGSNIVAADDVMATGFNWCPPVALIDAFSTVSNFNSLVNERLRNISSKIDLEYLLRGLGTSTYDYRPYFKSKK
jgi:3-hydroxyacyl-CoA dehydrogenase